MVALWSEPVADPAPTTLSVDETVSFAGWSITAVQAASPTLHPRSTVLVDPSVLSGGTVVRAATEGERIEIKEGTKLVRDALAEMGAPRRLRSSWPVLANDAKIAAIGAGRVAPWARPAGEHAIAITQERM